MRILTPSESSSTPFPARIAIACGAILAPSPIQSHACSLVRAHRGLAILAVAASLLVTQAHAAQFVQAPSPAPAHKTAHRHTRTTPAQADPPPQAEPATPPTPPAPDWPVNDSPGKPEVTWDSHGLRIAATNASLHQILTDVAAATGAKVEGMATDERVFGEFGPGQARDVLSQLLNGSGYNVLMIGDQGQGTPRQIVLSARRSGSAPAAANRQNPDMPADEDAPEQPESEEQPPQPPLLNRPPMGGPPGAPRTPQQVLQELQQRQQQMQNEQQQQQQQQPPH
jgi:hypothetical protein